MINEHATNIQTMFEGYCNSKEKTLIYSLEIKNKINK